MGPPGPVTGFHLPLFLLLVANELGVMYRVY
jgi:hypothetical protein